MDFKDSILQFAARVDKLCPQIHTEEATKNALIMPFIQLLGYDVFNPFEVSPEFVADIGIKKGEKVDYAILSDGKPILLIECKHYTQDLNPHNSQLFRYFHTTEAKFSLLTNGIDYRFYTDLITANKMDDKPFFEFKITDIKENEIGELKKFHKSYFNVDNITNTASELKFLNQIKHLLHQDFSEPSDDFVRYFAKKVYPSAMTQKVLEQFKSITKTACAVYVSDIINDRLKTVLQVEVLPESASENLTTGSNTADTDEKIITTAEEISGHLMVKAILAEVVDTKRIIMRDAQSYCAILLDDNNRRPICRFYFNTKKLSVGIAGPDKNFTRYDLDDLEGLFGLKQQLFDAVKLYLA
ncbi:restriction endonuclease [Mucilaginibacter terrenus]|uniref:Restriction endonuclease n=1 Tax=Mucilaginibacter terrenus TaxID=2482727 RepID=A0A3E2NVZ4_9SPHI|nr:type I restriction endonuclease [Mucilaginibacter terrenus]RFZ85183.1 restriction endonuclease [Mucilaginibacter terrenus]